MMQLLKVCSCWFYLGRRSSRRHDNKRLPLRLTPEIPIVVIVNFVERQKTANSQMNYSSATRNTVLSIHYCLGRLWRVVLFCFFKENDESNSKSGANGQKQISQTDNNHTVTTVNTQHWCQKPRSQRFTVNTYDATRAWTTAYWIALF
jgi:hypothetical protein